MSLLVQKAPWTKQPPLNTGVRERHKNGFTIYGLTNRIVQSGAAPTTDQLSPVVGVDGKSTGSPSGVSTYYSEFPVKSFTIGTGDFTFAIHYEVLADDLSNYIYAFGSSATYFAYTARHLSNASKAALLIGGGTFLTAGIQASTRGNWRVVYSRRNGTVFVNINGLVSTISNSTSIAAVTSLALNTYQPGGGTGFVYGVNFYIAHVDPTRGWSDAEAANFVASPYNEIFAPRSRRLEAPSATGIAFDAPSNSGYQAAVSTYSWSHTCTGSNRFLAVDVSLLSAGQTVTGITYNGVALSLIGARSTVTSFGRVESWGLTAPATGSNTVEVTLSGVSTSAGTAVSYTGVHQGISTEAFNSSQATNVGAADATVTVTPIADRTWLHAAVATDDTSVTANQTTRNNVTGAGGSGADEDTGPITPAAATAMSYTNVAALATWAIGGYAIRPLSASSGVSSYNYFPSGISSMGGAAGSRANLPAGLGYMG